MKNQKEEIYIYTKEELKKQNVENRQIQKENLFNKKTAAQHKK